MTQTSVAQKGVDIESLIGKARTLLALQELGQIEEALEAKGKAIELAEN